MQHSHTRDEVAQLERASGLQLAGYLAVGAPAILVPILARPRTATEARRLALALNGRQAERLAA